MLKLGGWPRLTWGRGRSERRPRGAPLAPLGSSLLVPIPPRGRPRRRWARAVGRTAGRGAESTTRRARPPGGPGFFGPPRVRTVGQSPHPFAPAVRRAHGVAVAAGGRGRGATRGVTPRQACPRPSGLGRNLRSKIRWFAGFCNSHHVSHFATFFIDARA